ncbi:CorA family divalent cation transporter [Yoonia sp.]|uniref:CorA family divalent cation transporter n=1 Tax=Yoonia sp. TaxID=2212373 RepID=UPI0025F8D314|nr:CorA family divalent cation transporter [Yoonia sp.]
MAQQQTRPRVDTLNDGLFLTLRGINRNAGADMVHMVSLRLWVTPQLVITVHRLRVFVCEDLRAQIAQGNAAPSAARLLAWITENLIDRIEAVSVDLEKQADNLEKRVYDLGTLHAPALAALHRNVIKLRGHIGPVRAAPTDLARTPSPLIPADLRHRLRDNANRPTRSVDEMSEVRDRLHTLTTHLDLTNNNGWGATVTCWRLSLRFSCRLRL